MKITILVDYKGRFESKYSAFPYRSGMDLQLLSREFYEHGFVVEFKQFHELDYRNLEDCIYLFTSDETKDGHYKSYIEDIIYGLSLNNKKVIPEYKYLKAHNNKVFMEILRSSFLEKEDASIFSRGFGTYEEFLTVSEKMSLPIVLKPAAGSKSRGVSLNNNLKSLKSNLKKISRSLILKDFLYDKIRRIRHKKYIENSIYTRKFILQNYIGELDGDWKVLIYGDKYFPLYRKKRKEDFRASGSGNLYFREDLDNRILEYAAIIKEKLNTPVLSLDIAIKNETCYLLEFQVLYFGTYTIENASFFFIKLNDHWEIKKEDSLLEKVYVEAISQYLKNQIKIS